MAAARAIIERAGHTKFKISTTDEHRLNTDKFGTPPLDGKLAGGQKINHQTG
jgi:hypothetical protein